MSLNYHPIIKTLDRFFSLNADDLSGLRDRAAQAAEAAKSLRGTLAARKLEAGGRRAREAAIEDAKKMAGALSKIEKALTPVRMNVARGEEISRLFTETHIIADRVLVYVRARAAVEDAEKLVASFSKTEEDRSYREREARNLLAAGGMRIRLTQADYDAIPRSLKSWWTRPDGERVRITADSVLDDGVWSTVVREVEIIESY